MRLGPAPACKGPADILINNAHLGFFQTKCFGQLHLVHWSALRRRPHMQFFGV